MFDPIDPFRELPPIIYESEIKQKLSEYVSGQEEAVDLLAYIGHMYTLQNYGIYCGVRKSSFPKINTLVTGPTGFGKTYIIRKFAEVLGLPYKKIDCSSVSAEGWRGTSLSAFIEQFLQKSRYGFGILHLDEVDKMGETGRENSDHRASMQFALLDLLDGDYHYMSHKDHIGMSVELDNINNCLLILSGSFQSHRVKQGKKIGFKHDNDVNTNETWREKLDKLGFVQELAGRIVCSVELKKYTAEQIKQIVMNTKESAYNKYLNLFGRHKALHSDEIDEIIQRAEKHKFGLRELETLFFEKFYNKRMGV